MNISYSFFRGQFGEDLEDWRSRHGHCHMTIEATTRQVSSEICTQEELTALMVHTKFEGYQTVFARSDRFTLQHSRFFDSLNRIWEKVPQTLLSTK